MNSKKTSEERPEDIRSVAEQPSDDVSDSPAYYLRKLKTMMSPDNSPTMSLLEFLQKDPVSDLVSQRQTPKEWLEKLTKVEFADPTSIFNLRFDLVKDNVGEFVLCTDGKDTFDVSPYPGAMSVDDTPVPEYYDVHPGLLSLEFVDESDNPFVSEHGNTVKPSGVDGCLPSLVLPIGQLLKGYTTESGIKDSDETNYVLVVDAVAPEHPVWLIFNRDAEDVFEEEEENYVDIHPDAVDLVFDGTEKNFDAAKVLPSIHDWFQSYESISLTQIRDSFRKTGLTGKVKARVVTAEDASVLWNKDASADEDE